MTLATGMASSAPLLRSLRASQLWTIAAVALLYVAGFDLAYRDYLAQDWLYWGFEYHGHEPGTVLLFYVLALLPVVWTPTTLDRPSVFFLWAILLVVHMPSVLTALRVHTTIGITEVGLVATLTVGHGLVTLVARGLRLPRPAWRVDQRLLLLCLLAVSAAVSLALYRAYGDVIAFVGFESIYEQRMAAEDAAVTGIVTYLYWWLMMVLMPLLMVLGIARRRPSLVLLAVAGNVFCYGVTAAKTAVLLTILVPAVYWLCARFHRSIGLALAGGVMLLTLVSLAAVHGDETARLVLGGVFLMRTLGTPGLTMLQYQEFFDTFGHTFWSHLTWLRPFLTYPYENEVFYLIGIHYYGNERLSANAHFWATDGLAAAGLIGIPIISILCGGALAVLDACSRHLPPGFVAAWACGTAVALTNVGLMTTLVTYGLVWIVLLATLVELPERSR